MNKNTRAGAYRDFVSPILSDSVSAEVEYLSNISTKGSINVSGDIGHRNIVSFSKRFIKEDSLSLPVVIGDDNIVDLYFRSKTPSSNNPHTLQIGNENRIKARTSENPVDIEVGSRNVIDGFFNAGNIVIGDNNLLYDFTGEISDGVVVSATDKLGSLMFSTKITEPAGVGSTYVEVLSTHNMMIGGEIKFGTVGAAFARKKIKSIIGVKVYLDEPLSLKESTYPEALVFNDLPETEETKVFYTSADAVRLSKRLPISEDSSLPLREIEIDGTFSTKIFFVRSSDNIAIVKNLLPSSYPAGTRVVAKGWYPYEAKTWNITGVVDSSAKVVSVENPDGAYIGREITDSNGDAFSIVGFIDSNIVLSGIPALGIGVSDSVPIVLPTLNTIAIIEATQSADNAIITIPEHEFSEGDTVLFTGFSDLKTIVSVTENTIELNSSLMPAVLNNTICFGNYIVDRSFNHRDFVESHSDEIHNYLFGAM